MASQPGRRILVTSADAAAVPGGVRVLPVGLFNSREALSYLMWRLSADPGQRIGAIELVRDLGCEPVALAQASAVIASFAMSCHDYRGYFVHRREQLTDSSGVPPASAVTWTLSFEHADRLAPASLPSGCWRWPRCWMGTEFPKPSSPPRRQAATSLATAKPRRAVSQPAPRWRPWKASAC